MCQVTRNPSHGGSGSWIPRQEGNATAWSPALRPNGSGSVMGVALGLGRTPDLGLQGESLVTWGEGCKGSMLSPSSAQA